MSVPDMTALESLDEGSMLANLEGRLIGESNPYTYVSTVLVAVNPLKAVPVPKDETFVETAFDPTAPHPNALAELAYQRLRGGESDQSLVVSGESGAGKTESSKIVIQYLTRRSHGEGDLADRVVAMSPVLEAFGNASTNRNPNSSRFGRFVKMVFTAEQTLVGGELETYLLEKSRVVRQNKGERNFHSLHMMLAERRELDLGGEGGRFRCMPTKASLAAATNNRGGGGPEMAIPQYAAVTSALSLVRVDKATAETVWAALGAVVLLADVKVEETVDSATNEYAGHVDTAKNSVLDKAASFLGLKEGAAALAAALTTRVVRTVDAGEIQVKRTPQDVEASRDAACRWLYGAVFQSLVIQCNDALHGGAGHETNFEGKRFIGILDIFGFETHDGENGLETLLINYANEGLQQLFCDAVFAAELDLYEQEGILDGDDALRNVDKPDSTPTIDLLVGFSRGKPGVLKLLDAQCAIGGVKSSARLDAVGPKRSSSVSAAGSRDATFLAKIHSEFSGHAALASTAPLEKRHLFHVKHYAGVVGYTVIPQNRDLDPDKGWVSTNLDAVPESIPRVVATSTKPFVASLGGLVGDSSNQGHPGGGNGGGGQSNGSGSEVAAAMAASGNHHHHRKQSAEKKTVSSRFAASMTKLASTLQATDCGFIRCIKPTPRMVPNVFDVNYVREQLRALGIVAATEVLRVGLPHRVEYAELVKHTVPAAAKKGFEGEPHDVVVACILSAFDVAADDYRLGTTRIFFPASALARVNDALAFDEAKDPERAKVLAAKLAKAKDSAKAAGKAVAGVRADSDRAKKAVAKGQSELKMLPLADIDAGYDHFSDSSKSASSSSSGVAGGVSVVEGKLDRARSEVQRAEDAVASVSTASGGDREDVLEAKAAAEAATEKLGVAEGLASEATASEEQVAELKQKIVAAKEAADAARSVVDRAKRHSAEAEAMAAKAGASARRLRLEETATLAKETKLAADAAEKAVTDGTLKAHFRSAFNAWSKKPLPALRAAADAAAAKKEASGKEADLALDAAKKALALVDDVRAALDELRRQEEERQRKEEEARRLAAEAEAKRLAEEAAEAKRLAEEAAEAKRLAEEEAAEAKRLAEEEQEEEQRRAEEEEEEGERRKEAERLAAATAVTVAAVPGLLAGSEPPASPSATRSGAAPPVTLSPEARRETFAEEDEEKDDPEQDDDDDDDDDDAEEEAMPIVSDAPAAKEPPPSSEGKKAAVVGEDPAEQAGDRQASRLRRLKRWFVLEPNWDERSKPKVATTRGFMATASSTRSLQRASAGSSDRQLSSSTLDGGASEGSNPSAAATAATPGSLRDMVYRGINTAPYDAQQADSRLALLHTIVKRKAVGMMSSYQFELYLSSEPTKLILAARRPTSGHPGYAIYDNTADKGGSSSSTGFSSSSSSSSSVTSGGRGGQSGLPKKMVAKLRESTMHQDDIHSPGATAAPAASRSEAKELATFGQERPNGSMPREICVLLAPTAGDGPNAAPRPFALNAHVANADTIDPAIPVFVQRDPVIRDGMYLLNFRGRGRVASGKNFQLVKAAKDFKRDSIDHSNDEAVVLQFCKVSANRFHLDFAPPFTPLAAFSLAVSICLG
eukprot:CAMPEP_0118913986 /NCGR_PEP_ID=MMETSP1166-20130328/14536_1 /TAXON_ID=1104430 /ORGANISM="Chrysoreinhardia sp, Strain CCMP3193" /LENGTH=1604 /DNA_ID=CAMNT_0006853551 /DNA_START=50 /DNA_END=4864 /DNA_ORIENTATION=+